jgi:hypothetical protein
VFPRHSPTTSVPLLFASFTEIQRSTPHHCCSRLLHAHAHTRMHARFIEQAAVARDGRGIWPGEAARASRRSAPRHSPRLCMRSSTYDVRQSMCDLCKHAHRSKKSRFKVDSFIFDARYELLNGERGYAVRWCCRSCVERCRMPESRLAVRKCLHLNGRAHLVHSCSGCVRHSQRSRWNRVHESFDACYGPFDTVRGRRCSPLKLKHRWWTARNGPCSGIECGRC